MKLFQQLLVAPAALGLLATGANAAELNINGVSDYAASADQVSSNITMIPAIFYLPESSSAQSESGFEQFGAVIQTVFKF